MLYFQFTWPKGTCQVLPSLGVRKHLPIYLLWIKWTNWKGCSLDGLLQSVWGFVLLIRSTQRNKSPKGIKKGVSIYMGINYSLFICFLWRILMHSLRKSLPEACIMLCKLTVFDIIFIQFYAFFCKVFIFTSYLCKFVGS